MVLEPSSGEQCSKLCDRKLDVGWQTGGCHRQQCGVRKQPSRISVQMLCRKRLFGDVLTT